jgi:hypothetical protein
MRFGSLCLLLVLSAAACAAPDVQGDGLHRVAGDDGNDDGASSKKKSSPTGTGTETGDTSNATPTDTSGTTPTTPGTTTTPTTPIADADKDGIADDVDCAPNDPSIVGSKLAVDDLTTDKQLFLPATGFGNNWSYSSGYIQSRLANAPDQSLLQKDPNVTDATVEVIAASTEISSGITPILRQMFITFGTTVTDGNLTAVGCGLEVDGSQTVTQKTTVARLNGSATSVSSTPLDRVDRTAVQAGEEFKIKGTLKNGLLTCEVTIKGNQTTTAQANVGVMKGSIGFFTKQTKALFRQLNACKLK